MPTWHQKFVFLLLGPKEDKNHKIGNKIVFLQMEVLENRILPQLFLGACFKGKLPPTEIRAKYRLFFYIHISTRLK
jgi:hypothetical protein